MEYLIVVLVFYVGAVLITRALRRRSSSVPTEPQPPQPATDRQRGYLSSLQRDKPDAASSVLADLGITDVWDPELTLERASEAIDRIVGKDAG